MLPLIEVFNLSKSFKIYRSARDKFRDFFFPSDDANSIKVLEDLSFEVYAGQSLAIVGRNGVGKSTLLKILVGITSPTSGSFRINGRVAAILELGMGFHGEFTGSQNVVMSAQLMGHSFDQIQGKLEEIRDFAEIGEYFDLPVKFYSSGMQVRLAFSVATAFNAEILIIDEALSVGDAYFQHKSFAKMRELQRSGSTFLFVSHDPGAIKNLCQRAILINQGRIVLDSTPSDVLDYYNALIAIKSADQLDRIEQSEGRTRSGSYRAQIMSAELLNSDLCPSRVYDSAAPARLEVKIRLHESMSFPVCGFLIRDRLGNDIFGTNTYHLNGVLDDGHYPAGDYEVGFAFPALNLGIGSYSMSVALHKDFYHMTENYDWIDRALIFEIVRGGNFDFIGCSRLEVSCELPGY